jgi:hypothetical protein
MRGIARFLHRSTATKIAAPELILWAFIFLRLSANAPCLDCAATIEIAAVRSSKTVDDMEKFRAGRRLSETI